MKRLFQTFLYPSLVLFLYLFFQFNSSVIAQHEKSSQVPSPIWNFPKSKNNGKYLALTFDDGPHELLTPDLLDQLKKTNTKVTFFVMGVKAVIHPNILKRAHQEGHEIANHVWDHPVLSKIPWQEVDRQLKATSDAIYNATSAHPKVMRPPYGNTNNKLSRHISSDVQYPVIMWSLDTQDWRRPGSNEIVKRVLDKAEDGTVILCHDIHPGTIEAIPIIIEQMRKKGFEFKTVSELIDLHYFGGK